MPVPCRLPYGLWQDGRVRRDVELRPLDGADELALAELPAGAPAAQAASVLIDRCLSRPGESAPAGVAAALTVGDREVVLRRLYGLSFGPRLVAALPCPSPDCGETVEIDLALADLDQEPPEPGPLHLIARAGEAPIRFRLPTGGDQERAARDPGPGAVAAIATACAQAHVPDDALEAFGDRVATLDPNAEAEIALACPACGSRASALLDAYELVRAGIGGVGAIFHDVDRLARAYGWSEREILALPRARRRRYRALAAGEEAVR